MASQTDNVLNGWDLEAFQETVATVERNPDAGRVTWRGRVSWNGHFGLDAHADAIEQLGEVIPRRFTMRGDHPPELLGENTGPTAVETLLAALGACIAGTYAAHATAQGVELDGLEVAVESAIDLNGFLQLAPTPAGLDGVAVTVKVARTPTTRPSRRSGESSRVPRRCTTASAGPCRSRARSSVSDRDLRSIRCR
jgi:OsmC-like protein